MHFHMNVTTLAYMNLQVVKKEILNTFFWCFLWFKLNNFTNYLNEIVCSLHHLAPVFNCFEFCKFLVCSSLCFTLHLFRNDTEVSKPNRNADIRSLKNESGLMLTWSQYFWISTSASIVPEYPPKQDSIVTKSEEVSGKVLNVQQVFRYQVYLYLVISPKQRRWIKHMTCWVELNYMCNHSTHSVAFPLMNHSPNSLFKKCLFQIV